MTARRRGPAGRIRDLSVSYRPRGFNAARPSSLTLGGEGVEWEAAGVGSGGADGLAGSLDGGGKGRWFRATKGQC